MKSSQKNAKTRYEEKVLITLKRRLAKKYVKIIWRVIELSHPEFPQVFKGILIGIERGENQADGATVTLKVKNVEKFLSPEGRWEAQTRYEEKPVNGEGVPVILYDQPGFFLAKTDERQIETYCPNLGNRIIDNIILPPAAFSATIDY
jgi:hypothetical protein